MDVGIGLPNSVAGATGDELLEFARRADAAGFSTLGTIDRIVYDNHEPLTTLAGAAAVTERIRLMTSVLLGPLRTNPAILAKQAATVHSLSGGRFRLGIAIGRREDDCEISGVPCPSGALESTARWSSRSASGRGRGSASLGASGPT
jgi:alkanesulfonate monooxygenase SsuD/methylene tetrahydromethanopterin reductase-like flavin-dependent oxidoreductase (luciferase family)